IHLKGRIGTFPDQIQLLAPHTAMQIEGQLPFFQGITVIHGQDIDIIIVVQADMNHLAGVQYVSHLFQIRNLSVSSAQDTALLLSVLTSLYTECSVSSIGKNISSYFSDQSGRHASHHGE